MNAPERSRLVRSAWHFPSIKRRTLIVLASIALTRRAFIRDGQLFFLAKAGPDPASVAQVTALRFLRKGEGRTLKNSGSTAYLSKCGCQRWTLCHVMDVAGSHRLIWINNED